MKIGIGYDIHRLVKGRPLVLGGVEIPFDKGLEGHSDADVLLHAICDAILGALAKGDIGEHFPNTDEKYRGISSLTLLAKVNAILQEEGFQIANIDSVILAEAPPIKPRKETMKKAISEVLKISPLQINIKATTQEGIGFGGGQEAMAAYAVVLIQEGGH